MNALRNARLSIAAAATLLTLAWFLGSAGNASAQLPAPDGGAAPAAPAVPQVVVVHHQSVVLLVLLALVAGAVGAALIGLVMAGRRRSVGLAVAG